MLSKLYEAQDPASLGVMRLLFGFLMLLDIPQERGMSMLHKRWAEPDTCNFPLFSWVQPLPLEWMYMVYAAMFLSAIGIMLGFLYRLSCTSFVLTYWYLFFLDKTTWNNHSYLYGLVGFMLLLTNAHHYWSVDALLWPSIRNVSVPRWHYGIFKFQFTLVYFYAGLKKLDMDWVSGYSMTGLSRQWVFDPLRYLGLSNDVIDHFFVHICGLTFDLIEGFLLLFDRTRPFGFLFGGMFHLMNSQMFSIGMFPWTMLATMPIFCHAAWPKKLISHAPGFFKSFLPTIKQCKDNIVCSNVVKGKLPRMQWFSISIASLYVALQLTLPYSHSITKGYNAWTQGLYGYSWDMMVHSWTTQHVVIKVVDNATGEATYLRPGAFIKGRKERRWNTHPDMIKQYALCLAENIKKTPELEIQQPRIYFDVWRSLNKRFQQRLIDPNVDMVTAPWSHFQESTWIRPLLTKLTPWRKSLKQIATQTYEKSNISDVTFVADFPGLFLENYIDHDVMANLTVLHGEVKVEYEDKNFTLGVNDSIRLPRNETHIVHVTSETPACYMYESFNVTLEKEDDVMDDHEAEYQRKMKEEEAWKTKTSLEKLTVFMGRKYELFKLSFVNAFVSFKIIASRLLKATSTA
ncbi:vitamin K-dependent gamma-carboxylase-like [Rhopilema esculentum]|uniref:vitamin K-dependent gamma-carboxylase-like n=1 Tax=Rhopilema esculentum TaxID=499914 RepID=UPI0031E0B15E